jgi:hypothetical protein
MRLLRRIPMLAWIFGVIAAAGLIAWPLGGWDTVRVVSKEIPTFAEGEVFHGHRFDVTVNDVHLTKQDPAGYSDADDGEIFLIARVEVMNVWHEPSDVSALVRYNLLLENGKFDHPFPPTVVLVADGTTGPELNQGLSRTVDLVWTISDTAVEPGDTVTFQLYDSVPRAALVFYGTSWVDLVEVGTAKREVAQ